MNASHTAAAVLEWARVRPDAPALGDEDRLLSYAELAAAVRQAVVALRSFGVGAGDRVVAVGENCVCLGILILALSELRACAVLENARRAAAEIDGIVTHSRPRLAVFVHTASPDAREHSRRLGADRHATPALGDIGVVSFPAAPAEDERVPADVAAMIYTTGSTGMPKGVMLTHANLNFIAAMMQPLRGMSAGDRVYGVLPISHVMGHASVFLGALHAGAFLHLAARFSASSCVAFLARQRITALQGAPAMFAKIVDHCRAGGVASFPSMRFIGSGGAPIDPNLRAECRRVFGRVLHNGYGLTEGASLCWTRLDDRGDDNSVGTPLPGVELAIGGPRQPATPESGIGELWVRGPSVMRGYFRNAELTSEVMTADGWFNTQDLARVGHDGRVYIEGRTKDVIIRSGFKVYPLEVETALNAHPLVLHSAVVGRPATGNEEVVAYVEPVPGATVDTSDLMQHLSTLISPYKRPNQIVVVASLPIAANGKVLKRQLPR